MIADETEGCMCVMVDGGRAVMQLVVLRDAGPGEDPVWDEVSLCNPLRPHHYSGMA